MLNKKGQLKIQEMAFVLVAVVFLFFLVFLFYARFQGAQMAEQAKVLREFRSATLLKVVAGLPELQCALQGHGVSVCIDKDKLSEFIKMQANYSELWQNSNIAKIEIEEVYPDPKEKYLVYSKTAGNFTTYSTYIPLCSGGAQIICSIAKIKIATIMPIK
jgi:hypothetical protein